MLSSKKDHKVMLSLDRELDNKITHMKVHFTEFYIPRDLI